MKDAISKFLTDNGWIANDDEFNKGKQVTHTIVVNGQPISKAEDVKYTIKYIGEGSFFNVGEEEETLYGYNIGASDIWVLNVDDFIFWYNQIRW